MHMKVATASVAPKGKASVPADLAQDNPLVLERNALKKAIKETENTNESIRASFEEHAIEIDAAYISKMLSGDKPIGLKHIAALPADVQGQFYAAMAEAHGYIVVKPAHGLDAQKALVAGFMGLLVQQTAIVFKGGNASPARATLAQVEG